MISRNSLLLGVAALLVLTACETIEPNDGQYWQRISPSESLYQQGPKAQQMLNRDIGRCVFELKELEDLGVVEDPIKVDTRGRVLDPDEAERSKNYDKEKVPKSYESAVPTDSTFRDFEGCMFSKGWQRVMHTPRVILPPPS